MELSKPFIHLFKNEEKYYIYDVNKNTILNVQKYMYELLDLYMQDETGLPSDKKSEIIQIIKTMRKDGYFSSQRVMEIIHPEDEILEFHLESKVAMISLQVTQQCNLRCEYCVYSGKYTNRIHSNKIMGFATAKRAIDFLNEHSRDMPSVGITFYGGEPLLQFNLIKQCIEYAEKSMEGKHLIFNLTSNATLLNEEIISYFEAHHVYMLISIDGPENIHDRSRKFASGQGSFQTIMNNIKTIQEKFPDYQKNLTINTVINHNSSFSAIDAFFSNCEQVKDIALNVQFVKSGSEDNIYATEKFLAEYNNEMSKLYLSMAGRMEERFISKIVKNKKKGLVDVARKLVPMNCLPEKGHPSGPCIPGVQRPFIDIEGNIFPCERVNESSGIMNIGNIYDGFDINQIRKLLNIGKISEQQCKNCWAFMFCTLCAASADHNNELCPMKKESFCNDVRSYVESLFKDYCALKELGVSFEDDIEI